MADHLGQVTLEVRAGDAVVVDYRLLHGTQANVTAD
jgi:ectoine hydroxylase-related dioxygenase (phytanoyl-CoA dioxygenase family)